MRKYQKAAVVAAVLGSVSFIGGGVSQAYGNDDAAVKLDNKQNQQCSANESYITGSKTLSDTAAPVNGLGYQYNDQSEHRSVTCNQLFTIGK